MGLGVAAASKGCMFELVFTHVVINDMWAFLIQWYYVLAGVTGLRCWVYLGVYLYGLSAAAICRFKTL